MDHNEIYKEKEHAENDFRCIKTEIQNYKIYLTQHDLCKLSINLRLLKDVKINYSKAYKQKVDTENIPIS